MSSSYPVARILAASMMGAVALFPVVSYFTLMDRQMGAAAFDMPAQLAIAVIGALAILASSYVDSIVPQPKAPDPKQKQQRRLTVLLVSYAMKEAGAIIGLVLSILSGLFVWSVGFSMASLLSMLLAFPKAEEYNDHH